MCIVIKISNPVAIYDAVSNYVEDNLSLQESNEEHDRKEILIATRTEEILNLLQECNLTNSNDEFKVEFDVENASGKIVKFKE